MSNSIKFPKSLGAAADLLFTLQQQRLEKAKEVKTLQEQEAALSEHILKNMLPEAKLDGARGSLGQVSKQPEDWAEVTDWDAYFAYMGKKKAWHLIQKRVSITSLRELWENGKQVPGVEKKEGYKLHVSKVK